MNPRITRVRDRHPELPGKLGDDFILQGEDAVERSIDFGIGERFAADNVHDAGRDADPIAVSLIAAGDGEPGMEIGGHVPERPVRAPRGLDHPPAIDDPKMTERAEVAGDCLSDAGGEPGRIGVTGDVHEIHDGNGPAVLVAGICVRPIGGARRARVDRGDEPVATPCHRLDELRRAGIVAKRLP